MEETKRLNCKMIKCPNRQASWLFTQFQYTPFEMPEMFGDKPIFAKQLLGIWSIRLDDYQGNSQSFLDDCFLSYTYGTTSQDKYNLLLNQLEVLRKEAESRQYFELCANIATIISYMQRSKGYAEREEYV